MSYNEVAEQKVRTYLLRYDSKNNKKTSNTKEREDTRSYKRINFTVKGGKKESESTRDGCSRETGLSSTPCVLTRKQRNRNYSTRTEQ